MSRDGATVGHGCFLEYKKGSAAWFPFSLGPFSLFYWYGPGPFLWLRNRVGSTSVSGNLSGSWNSQQLQRFSDRFENFIWVKVQESGMPHCKNDRIHTFHWFPQVLLNFNLWKLWLSVEKSLLWMIRKIFIVRRLIRSRRKIESKWISWLNLN